MQADFYKQIFENITKNLLAMLLPTLLRFWYLWALILIVCLIKAILWISRVYKIVKAGLPEIDKMTGQDFEIFLEHLFLRLGYKVERVGHPQDCGADLVIEKDGIRTVVQAKRWKKSANVKAIQEINTAMAHYNATKALAVTNNSFTSYAIRLAKENKVELIDREKLASLILQRQ